MADKEFVAILTLLVPQVVQLICENYPVDEMMASKEFYESKVYSLLEQEDTKLWHFSPLTIFNMYDEEKRQETLRFQRRYEYEQTRRFSHLLCRNLQKRQALNWQAGGGTLYPLPRMGLCIFLL